MSRTSANRDPRPDGLTHAHLHNAPSRRRAGKTRVGLPASLMPGRIMEVIDYNGEGRWSRNAILDRYARYAAELGVVARDLSPSENIARGRHWVHPVMYKVIEGIEAGDAACVRLGIEFIEEDAKFAFGKILKSSTARALRRASLSDEQRQRIRKRVLGMLRAGHVPHEFREYAKLVKKVGFSAADMGEVPGTSERVSRFRSYLQAAARAAE